MITGKQFLGCVLCLMFVGSISQASMLAVEGWEVDVDQPTYTSVEDISTGDRNGQMFEALSDGLLVGVRLVARPASWGGSYPAGSDSLIRIRELREDGVPVYEPLAQGLFLRDEFDGTEPQWITVLFDEPYEQSEGERLCLMIEDLSSGRDGWNDYGLNHNNPYPDGYFFFMDWSGTVGEAPNIRNNTDMAFQTWVVVPEPFSGTLLLLGIALMANRRGCR